MGVNVLSHLLLERLRGASPLVSFVTHYRVTISEGKQMSVNQQVKHIMSDFPYYLGDCLIVEMVEYETPLLVDGESFDFEIYRIRCFVSGNLRYLDLITNKNQKFLGIGGYNHNKCDFKMSQDMCRSLAIQKYLEEAY